MSNQPPLDSGSENEQRGARVRKFWFNSLPSDKQDAIIKPEFEKANPSHKDKVEATRDYKRHGGA